ncbi:hypothetical protein HK104_008155 [Borealophlyctis nickersoniae]|nr:hypothetical protein HK104_008155 [Borealophlyctis nickersoniae]
MEQNKTGKGANDLARAKKTSKITSQIISAIRCTGGESDPSQNLYLAAALQLARTHQVPKANVETAIKKGLGTYGGATEIEPDPVTYEGLGPGGVACMVEALTNNRNRTFAEVRHNFVKRGGSITPVQYLFQRRGRVVFSSGTSGHDLERMEEEVVECGLVEDIESTDEDDKIMEVVCAVSDVLKLKKALEGKGYEIKELESAWLSKEKVELNEEQGQKFEDLLAGLEDLEDVVKVHHNAG